LSIVLTFQSSAGDRLSKGPYSSVRFEGTLIREPPAGAVIASHVPDGWSVEGRHFLRVDCEVPVVVLWDGSPAQGTPGTTGHFSSVDGVVYIDRRILAFLDAELNDWYLKREGHHTRALVLEPVKLATQETQ
jgi:hypothetical protein